MSPNGTHHLENGGYYPMYQIDFKKPVHIHFIGIGGTSMSGLAELLYKNGFTVSGSDRERSDYTIRIEKVGIDIIYEQVAANITDDIAVAVYSAAIHPDNPEYHACEEKGIPLLSRAELLGQVMTNYDENVCIAGTHGKTTTTSIVSHMYLADKRDPTISVGAMLPLINSNLRIGASDTFITEACEYTNSFLNFHPTIGVILTIEEEHMDYFKDLDEIRGSFHKFASFIPKDGTLIINSEIDRYEDVTDGLSCNVITYSTVSDDADYVAKDIEYDEMGMPTFTVYKNGEKFDDYHLHIPGRHNVCNTLSAIAVAVTVGISKEAIQEGLAGFNGAHRRYEYKGKVNGFDIIDDYGHHPTELRATLEAAKRHPHKEMWCVFQPHTFSRTKQFLREFSEALLLADHVIMTEIYAAREVDPGDISSQDVADMVNELGGQAIYLKTFDEVEKFVLKNLQEGDLLITMGSGSVGEIADDLIGA